MNKILEDSRGLFGKKELFNYILKHGPVSKNDISSHYTVSVTTASRILRELVNAGLVSKVDFGESIGGRKPALWEVIASSFYSIGVNLAPDKLEIILIDLSARIIDKHVFEDVNSDKNPREIVGIVIRSIKETQANYKRKIVGVGISTHGPLDRKNGIILEPLMIDKVQWENVPIREMIQREIDLPVFIDNRSRVGALSELWHGNAKNMRNVLFIITDYGIGAGIIANGKLLGDDIDITGSLGNMIINIDQATSNTETKGRLEDYATLQAMINMACNDMKKGKKSLLFEYSNGKPDNVVFDDICRGVEEGDPLCRKIVTDAATAFGIGLANFCSIIHPEIAVLGGEIIDKCGLYFDIGTAIAEKYIYPKVYNPIPYVKSKFDENAICIGAAIQVFNNFLE